MCFKIVYAKRTIFVAVISGIIGSHLELEASVWGGGSGLFVTNYFRLSTLKNICLKVNIINI